MLNKCDFKDVKMLANWETEWIVESYFDIEAIVIEAYKLCFKA